MRISNHRNNAQKVADGERRKTMFAKFAADGMDRHEIAERLGVRVETVNHYARQLGVVLRRSS